MLIRWVDEGAVNHSVDTEADLERVRGMLR